MPDYKSEQIRNITIIGHGGCGKTILAEGILHSAGVTNRFGKVEEGNTVSDYHKDEIEKQMSINSSLLNCFWKNANGDKIKFNIIDTPGFMDFVGEVKSSLRVTETALMVVDSFKGIEVGTEACFKHTKEYNNNIAFVINKLDTENATFEGTVEQLVESFGAQVAVAMFPVNHGIGFNQVVDVIKMKLYKFTTDGKGDFTIEDIPANLKDKADDYHQKLIEAVASEDDALMEKFFETGSLTEDEIAAGLRLGMKERQLFPVFCISASTNVGIKPLMDFIADYTESPMDRHPEKGHRPHSEEVVTVNPDPTGDPVIFIFKTISEKNIGELSFFRVYSGKVSPGMDLINEATGKAERLAQTYTMNGKDRKELSEVITGDFAGVVKLKDSHTNNTLCSKSYPVVLEPIKFPTPNMSMAIAPSRKGEEDKLGTALHSFHEEDPTFIMNYDPEISQTIIHGQGEIHINTIINRMKNKYGLEVVLSEPKIPYKETIRKKVNEVEFKHKKQTGGRGQYGHVVISLEPRPRGEGFEFVNGIVGGVVPGRFIPAVEKGIFETMQSGVLIGCKVIDIKASLTFGSYHNVDSDELSFKLAASQAFRKGFKDANPVILEPVYEVEIYFPEEFMGAVSGDVSSRRGKILGMESEGRLQVIKCHIPLSEMGGYSSKLRSFTQGRGTYTRKFSHYEDVPKEVETKIIADYEKKRAEEQK
jgi:elongation factor G